MLIITRQQAIQSRLNRYFTGIPCKRGHICERYTRSAICIDCLHPKFEPLNDRRKLSQTAKDQKSHQRAQLLQARSRMVRIRVRLYDGDLPLFQAAALSACMAREPLITLKDIVTRYNPAPIAASRHIYSFKVFPEDKESMFDLQDSLERSRKEPAPTPKPLDIEKEQEWSEWRA